MSKPKGTKNRFAMGEIARKNLSDAKMGHAPTNGKPCSVLGVKYDTIAAASLANQVSSPCTYSRLNSKSNKWAEWFYL